MSKSRMTCSFRAVAGVVLHLLSDTSALARRPQEEIDRSGRRMENEFTTGCVCVSTGA